MKIAMLDSPRSRLFAKLAEAINKTQDDIISNMFVQPKLLQETKPTTGAEIMMRVEAYQQRLPSNLYFSSNCLEPTDERMFPESKHRSARIKKKLIKRFGSEFVMKPCIWKSELGIYAHTSFRDEIKRRYEILYVREKP